MIETPCRFGPHQALMGILTQPAQGGVAPPPMAFLFFNAGVIPRFGPHRINVKLARTLAAAGQVSLRFDLSGLGDSPHLGGDGDFRVQAVRDIQSAMDHVTDTTGIRQFVLVGICSGATNAYWTCEVDARVVGVLMLDGFSYASRWTKVVCRYKRLAVASPRDLFMRAWNKLSARKRAPDVDESGLFSSDASMMYPTKEEFARVMQSLVDRQAEVLLIFTGSVIDHYSYDGQLQHAFAGQPWVERVRCLLLEEIDHTATTLASQRVLIDLVLAWLPKLTRACETQP